MHSIKQNLEVKIVMNSNTQIFPCLLLGSYTCQGVIFSAFSTDMCVLVQGMNTKKLYQKAMLSLQVHFILISFSIWKSDWYFSGEISITKSGWRIG